MNLVSVIMTTSFFNVLMPSSDIFKNKIYSLIKLFYTSRKLVAIITNNQCLIPVNILHFCLVQEGLLIIVNRNTSTKQPQWGQSVNICLSYCQLLVIHRSISGIDFIMQYFVFENFSCMLYYLLWLLKYLRKICRKNL